MIVLYRVYTAVLVSVIVSATFTDEILREHYFSILTNYASVFLAFCIIILSKHCKLRKKTDTISDALETDPEADGEQVIAETRRSLAWLKNLSVFCKRRPIYGIAAFVCMVFWMISLYLFGMFDSDEDLRTGSDPWSAKVLLLITAIALFAVVSVVAHLEKYVSSKTFLYEPFDENIEIPMKVYAPKVVAVLWTGQLGIFEAILIQCVLIFILVIISNCSEYDVTENGSKIKHTFLICAITCFNFTALLCLIERFLYAHYITKSKLLGLFEKNWHRNLKACELLLPEIEVNNLEDLRLSVLEKINQVLLTNKEKRIIDYIKRPLWKSKRAIVDTVFEKNREVIWEPLWPNQSPNRAPEDQALPGPDNQEPNRAPGDQALPRPDNQEPNRAPEDQALPRPDNQELNRAPEEQTPPRQDNQEPNRPSVVQTPPRQQNPALHQNVSTTPSRVSPPLTRSRARRITMTRQNE